MSLLSLNDAANLLGVSESTVQAWEKSGKLRAIDDPAYDRRRYAVSDLMRIGRPLPYEDQVSAESRAIRPLDVRAIRTLVHRLRNILRDHESNSNIIERFDELTKLLFLMLVTESHSTHDQPIERRRWEADTDYASRIRYTYSKVAENHSTIVPKTYAHIFMSDSAICDCVSALSRVSFENLDLDIKGLIYEEIVRFTFDKSENQQFFTPPSIARFMVAMMSDSLSGNICDPAAGTAGFLIEILKSQNTASSYTAIEVDERLAWVSGINLYSHGARNMRAIWLPDGGSLGQLANEFVGMFDTIITNPPFGSDVTDPAILQAYQLGHKRTSRRRGILFLERCHQLLRDGGMLAFIIDDGVLNLPSSRDVRHFITSHFKIDAIVSLPETTFMPYATVNTSILFLQKTDTTFPENHLTFFARAENVGRKGNGNEDYVYDGTGVRHLNSELPAIVDLFRSFRVDRELPKSRLAYVVDLQDIQGREEIGWRLDYRYHHPSRMLSRKQLAKTSRPLMILAQICHERNEMVVPSTELVDQMIRYTGLAHIEVGSGTARQVLTPANSLKSAVKRYDPKDIIFARMRPNLRKVALMDFTEGGYVSPECIVLSVREVDNRPIIDPLLLSALLRSDLVYGQIMHLITGTGRPRLAAKDLRRVAIPTPSESDQRNWRERYLSQVDAVQTLKTKAESLLRDAEDLQRESVERLAREFV